MKTKFEERIKGYLNKIEESLKLGEYDSVDYKSAMAHAESLRYFIKQYYNDEIRYCEECEHWEEK